MKGAVFSATAKAHQEVAEHEDDNVGVQAVNETEGAVETAAQTADTVRYSHKLKADKQAAKLESRADKANIEALYKKRMAENPQAATNPISRWRQKQAVKKEYAAIKAGHASAGTAAASSVGSSGAAAGAGKAVKETKDIGTVFSEGREMRSSVLLIQQKMRISGARTRITVPWKKLFGNGSGRSRRTIRTMTSTTSICRRSAITLMSWRLS